MEKRPRSSCRSQVTLQPLDFTATGLRLDDPRQLPADMLLKTWFPDLAHMAPEGCMHRTNVLLHKMLNGSASWDPACWDQSADEDWLTLDDLCQRGQLKQIMQGAAEFLQGGAQAILPSAAERLQASRCSSGADLEDSPAKLVRVPVEQIVSSVQGCNPFERDNDLISGRKLFTHLDTKDATTSAANRAGNSIMSKARELPSRAHRRPKSNLNKRCGQGKSSMSTKRRPVFVGSGHTEPLTDISLSDLGALTEEMSTDLDQSVVHRLDDAQYRLSVNASRKKTWSATERSACEIDEGGASNSNDRNNHVQKSNRVGMLHDMHAEHCSRKAELVAEPSATSSQQTSVFKDATQHQTPHAALFVERAAICTRARGLALSKYQGLPTSENKPTYVSFLQPTHTDVDNLEDCFPTSPAGTNMPWRISPTRRLVTDDMDLAIVSDVSGTVSSQFGGATTSSDGKPGTTGSRDSIRKHGGPLNECIAPAATCARQDPSSQFGIVSRSRSFSMGTPTELGEMKGLASNVHAPESKKKSGLVMQRASSAAKLPSGSKLAAVDQNFRPSKAHAKPKCTK